MPDILITPSSGTIRFSQNISDNAANIALSGSSIILSSTSGNININALSGVLINEIPVSTSGHIHTSSNITDFNSSVSGLLSTITNSGDNRVLTSTGSSLGINAESNLTFDGTLLNTIGSGNFTSDISASRFISSQSTADEGGEIVLARPSTNTAISGSVTIDVFQNKLRLFETTSSTRGYHLDLTEGANSAGTPLINKSLAFYTASDGQPPASNFATLDTRNSIMVLDFDAANTEYTVFAGVVPRNANLASGLKVIINWTATSATTGNCVWQAEFMDMDHDLDNITWGTATTATATTNATSGISNVTTITLLSSALDGLVAGEFFLLRIARLGGNGSDTMLGDAELISVSVEAV
jgi:hypothetical protein